MRPCAVLLPAGVLSVTGSSVWFFGRVVGEGKVCVFFFSCFLSSERIGLTRCHAGRRQICQRSQSSFADVWCSGEVNCEVSL